MLPYFYNDWWIKLHLVKIEIGTISTYLISPEDHLHQLSPHFRNNYGVAEEQQTLLGDITSFTNLVVKTSNSETF